MIKTNLYSKSDFTIHECKTCDNKTDFALVDMPYANKLLFQELQTINVVPRILYKNIIVYKFFYFIKNGYI